MSEYDDLLARVRSGDGQAAPTQSADNEYANLLAQVRGQDKSVTQANLNLASFANPASEAQKQQIARQLKETLGEDWSPKALDPEEAQRRLKVAEYDHVLQSSPKLAQKYLDTGYAERTFDDIHPLAGVEKAATAFGDFMANRWSALKSSAYSASAGGMGLVRPITDTAAELIPSDITQNAAEWVANYQSGTQKIASGMLQDKGDFLWNSFDQGLQSLGTNLAMLPAAILTGNPLMALLPMSAITGGSEYGKARDAGVAIPQAMTYATSQAAIEYATEMLPVTKFIGDLKAGAAFHKMLMNQIAKEIPGEQVATLMQDLNEWAVINPDKPFSAYLAERPSAAAQTLIATIVGVGGQVSTVKGAEMFVDALSGKQQSFADPLVQQAAAAQRTLEVEQHLTSLIDAAAQTASIARDPSAVQELVAAAAEDGNNEVFINARQFATVFNQAPIETAQALGVTPEALDGALAANTDIVVSLDVLATAVAQDQALRPIIEHARVDPADMSPSEARLWQSQQGEAFKAEAEAVLAQRQADAVYQTEVQQVHDHVLDQLNQSRRFSETVNKQYAGMVRDFYVTMADRAGMTVTEMAAKYPLKVVAEGTGQLNQNTDQINTPEFKQWFGESKVLDADGKPLVVYRGTRRVPKADKFGTKLGRATTSWAADPAAASVYSRQLETGNYGAGSTVTPAFISMKNPLDLRKLGETTSLEGVIEMLNWDFSKPSHDDGRIGWADVVDALYELDTIVYKTNAKYEIEASDTEGYRVKDFEELADLIAELGEQGNVEGIISALDEATIDVYALADSENFVEMLRRAGYDGVIHKDVFEVGAGYYEGNTQNLAEGEDGNPVIDAYRPFDQTQIKSAIGNRGTFDPNDPNILHQSENGSVTLRTLANEGNNQAILAQALMDRAGANAKDVANVLESVAILAESDRLGSIPALTPVLAEMRAAVLDDSKILDAVVGSVPVDVMNNLSLTQEAAKVLLHDEAMNENSSAFNADLVVSLPVDGASSVGLLVREAALSAAKVLRVSLESGRETAKRDAAMGASGVDSFSQNGSNRAFFDPYTNTIGLLENADLSSFLHESGHFFLEVMADMASRPDAAPMIRADMERLLAWFGIQGAPDVTPLEAWNRMTLEEKRQYHEQFARGFEAYLFEGKAPSVEIQGTFQKFKQWLTAVYKNLTSLNVTLTDEVRGVFDRMIASDEAIATAEAVRNYAPIFQTAEQAGMTAEEWAQYQGEATDATVQAVDEVQQRSIRDMRWLANAKAKKLKQLQEAAKQVRAQVMMDVRREVMSQPIYRAWTFLTGKDPAKAPKQEKADPNSIDPMTDDLLVAIAKLGGIDFDQAVKEWGMDPADKRAKADNPGGKRLAVRKDGVPLDSMGELLAQYGYIPTDEHGKHDMAEFEERFFDALAGREVMSDWSEAMLPTEDPMRFTTPENTPHGKLNTDILRAMYGTEDHAAWRLLSALRMTSPDGFHPNDVAGMFGFSSGDELVRRIAVAEDPKIVIEGMTDQRMLEQFGDLATPKDMELAAERAIHNDVRARVLTRELNALRQAVGQKAIMLKAARLHADAWLGRQKVRDAVKPGQHTAAESKSARAADQAFKAGDTATAAIHKRDQLLNNQLARQSLRAAEEVRKAVAYLKKFDKAGTRKAIDQAYLDQIDQLLERFDLRQVSEKQLEKRASLAKWLADQEAMGMDPVVDQRLVEDAQRQHYSTLTLDEFRGMVDTVKSIEHMGRLKNRLLTAKDKREFAKVVADLEKSLIDNANRTVKDKNPITKTDKVQRAFIELGAHHRKFASFIREMDGFKDGGPMWEYLVRGMNEAGDREASMRASLSQQLAEIFQRIKGLDLNAKTFLPEIGTSLRREEVIALALNSGNRGNVQRLLDGGVNNQVRAMTQQQLSAVLNRLSNQEWDFVEGVWALIESNRPAIAALEKALTGVEPKWVEPDSFTLESGRVIRGGYYPAKYNGLFSTRSAELESVTDLRQQMKGAMGNSSTRKSYTEKRAEEVSGRPLKLDLNVIAQHINEVTHRLAWQPWLIDARRILKAAPVENAIKDHYGVAVLNEMKDHLKAIAEGDQAAGDAFGRFAHHLRTGATIVGMGWNIMTALMQPVGITQSIERVGAKWIGRGLKTYIAHPIESTANVQHVSEFMRNRAMTLNREINDVLNTVRSEKMTKVEASYFYLIQKFQQTVDTPTWLGAYEKAIAEGNNDARAVALADQAVIDSQGGGTIKDLAGIQRGNEYKKLFTNFYSFFNVLHQRMVENYRGIDSKDPLSVGKAATNYLLLFVVPTVWTMAIKEVMRGDGEDDEELLAKYAKEQLSFMLGTTILGRELAGAISSFTGYQGPAGLRFIGEFYKFVKQTGQGEVDMPWLKATLNTVGLAMHLPLGQVARMVEGTEAYLDDQAGPQAILVGPPIKD